MNEQLYVSFLNAGDLSVLSQRIIKLASTIPEEAFIKEVIDVLQKDVENLKNARDINRKSKYTPELQKRKEIRNDAFSGLKEYCKACFKKHKTEAYHKAAAALHTILKQYSTIILNKGYNEQTDTIHRLLNELSEMKSQIQTINAKEWVEDLINAQEEFENFYHQKVDQEIDEDFPQVSEMMNSLKKHLHTLLMCLDIVEELRPKKLADIGPKINEFIIDTMTIARARKTRKGNVKDEPEEIEGQSA